MSEAGFKSRIDCYDGVLCSGLLTIDCDDRVGGEKVAQSTEVAYHRCPQKVSHPICCLLNPDDTYPSL